MSTLSVHNNPSLFPDPQRFNPDRWLAESAKELDNWNVAFGKGRRRCVASKKVPPSIPFFLFRFLY